jgi:subtilisin family serine protease
MSRTRKNKVGLLPHVREDVFGLTPDTAQIYGWELKKFNIPDKWRKSQGENTVVAVIDTGCDLNHVDLQANLLEGKNFVDINSPPMDDNGHGSHVAGTIAACNNDTGIAGVAPKAKIIPVKALDRRGSGNISSIVNGIIWSADQGVDFITMSLGSPNTTRDLEEAVAYAYSKGSIIFCAAGNNGEDVDIMYPAKCDNTIAIGAVDRDLKRTNFTCSGETLDFLAPGHEILSCVPGNQYAIMSGTSMSNPFAVGCACLALSLYKKNGMSHSLKTYEDYINLFKNNALHLTDTRYANQKKYEGYGIIHPI